MSHATRVEIEPGSRSVCNCGATVIWMEHERTGKPAPIEEQPRHEEPPERAAVLVDREAFRYRVPAPGARRRLRGPWWVNHWWLCELPARKAWRERVLQGGRPG